MIRGIDFSKADRRITIQKPTESRDATYNQITYGYTDVGTVWAILSEPSFNRNNETIEDGNKVQQERRNRFTIRYSSTFANTSEKWRILLGSETYEVSNVDIRSREGFIRLEGTYAGIAT